MIYKKTYNPVAGSSVITDYLLVYVDVLRVTRSGDNYNVFNILLSDIEPFNYNVAYDAAAGTLSFDGNKPFEVNEFINVIYKR